MVIVYGGMRVIDEAMDAASDFVKRYPNLMKALAEN